jgi:hypothetical protein
VPETILLESMKRLNGVNVNIVCKQCLGHPAERIVVNDKHNLKYLL